MVYLYLSIAIVAEVIGTSALKASAEFSRLWPSLLVVTAYCTAFSFFSLVLKTMPLGIAYAIWCGAGIALIAIVGAVVFRQMPDLPAIIGMSLIIAGVVVMNLFSTTTVH